MPPLFRWCSVLLYSMVSAKSYPSRPSAGALPSLNIAGKITISGISSGGKFTRSADTSLYSRRRLALSASPPLPLADMASQMLVAASDIVSGAGIFAGQPPSCAVVDFTGEPTMTCASQPASTQGPGCVGLNDTGAAPCVGCPVGMTVTYDHCKGPLVPFVQVDVLVAQAEAAAAAGRVPPLGNLADARVYLYRGTLDACYQTGSVNKTAAFFAALVSDAASQVVFEASIPSQHCMPTVDPWLSPASCGVNAPWAPPAMENCG
jgi:hypothetical protein